MRPAFTQEERKRASRVVVRFAEGGEFEYALDEIMQAICASVLQLPPARRKIPADAEWLQIAGTTVWLFDYPLDSSGQTIVDRFLRSGAALSAGERRYLERMRESRVGVFEIRAVKRDEGLQLRDIVSGEEFWVAERLGTHQARVHMHVSARVMQGPRGVTEMDGALVTVEPAQALKLKKTLRKLSKADAAIAIYKALMDRSIQPLPELVTADGDRMEFCEVVFDVRDETALFKALDRSSAFDRGDDGSYVWLEGRRVLGLVGRRGSRLVAEVQSRRRAERLVSQLERLAPGAVRHRITSIKSVEAALEEQRGQP